MDEADDSELDNYPNLGALFRRKLKDGVRPVDVGAPIVSPADGHIIWFGEVSPDGQLEQVGVCMYTDILKCSSLILKFVSVFLFR